MARLYSYVAFGGRDLGVLRLGGPGLGNLLFPWARSVIDGRRHGLLPLAPTWPQLKVGPILRRERDKRFYFGLMRRSPRHIQGFARALILSRVPRATEKDLQAALECGEDRVVVYAGMAGLFAPLRDHAAMIRDELRELTRPAHLPESQEPYVGVHVRLGDFQQPSEGVAPGQWNQRTPLSWYCHTVEELLQCMPGIQVQVFSDGTSEELAPLLEMPGVARARERSALASIWALSRASVIVGSGSTFSMWSAFLGGTPVIWPPGQMRTGVHSDSTRECEREPEGHLAEAFLARCRESNRSAVEVTP